MTMNYRHLFFVSTAAFILNMLSIFPAISLPQERTLVKEEFYKPLDEHNGRGRTPAPLKHVRDEGCSDHGGTENYHVDEMRTMNLVSPSEYCGTAGSEIGERDPLN